MVDGPGPSQLSQHEAGLTAAPQEVPSEPIDPKKEYQLSEAVVTADYKMSYIPSTLYLDLFLQGHSTTTGKGPNFGVKVPMYPLSADRISVYVGQGSLTVGIDVAHLTPQIGIGNIYISPTGISLGWFPLTSKPDPYLILAGSVILFLQTVLEGCESAEDCTLRFASRLLIASTPINTIREIMQKAGIDTSEKACDDLWEQNSYDRCLLYSASYMAQSLFEVAHDMVDSGIKDVTSDPYVRAMLLEEHDRIRFAENRGGIVLGKGSEIAKNIKVTTEETKAFLAKYKGWLADGSGAAPSEKELHYFLGGALYLLRKLQTSAVIDGDKLRITGGTPIDFKSAPDMIEFLQTTADIYKVFSTSDRLWGFVTNEIFYNAEAITSGAGIRCTESVINHWFRYKNLKSLVDEVSSVHMHTLFGLRKVHLMAKLRSSYEGDKKEGYLKALSQIELGERDPLIERRKEAMKKRPRMAAPIAFISKATAVYDGLELLLRLSYEDDPLVEMRGLDMTGLDDTPPYRSCFMVLYELEMMRKQGGASDYIASLQERADALFERVMKYHRGDVKEEVKSYDDNVRKEIRGLTKSLDKLSKLVKDKDAKAKLESKIKEFRRKIISSCLSDSVKSGSDIRKIISASEEMSASFDSLMLTIHEVLGAEIERISKEEDAEDVEGVLKKWSKDAHDAVEKMRRSYYSVQDVMKSTSMARIYVENREREGGDDV